MVKRLPGQTGAPYNPGKISGKFPPGDDLLNKGGKLTKQCISNFVSQIIWIALMQRRT
jgi:hypothetical protein